jgi:hypothetical protein
MSPVRYSVRQGGRELVGSTLNLGETSRPIRGEHQIFEVRCRPDDKGAELQVAGRHKIISAYGDYWRVDRELTELRYKLDAQIKRRGKVERTIDSGPEKQILVITHTPTNLTYLDRLQDIIVLGWSFLTSRIKI